MTPRDITGETTSEMAPEYPHDVRDEQSEGMKQLVEDRRAHLQQRHLLTRWASARPRPDQLDVNEMKSFIIKKIFLKDRYQVDSGLNYCPPTAPHRKHIRIKSGTDGRKYVPLDGSSRPRLVKSATVNSKTWKGYDALSRPTEPDPIPHLFTESLEKDRSKKEEHLQQWRNQVVKKVLIKRQKYCVPIDPTAPRIAPSVENSRNSLPVHRPTSEGHNSTNRAASAASHPISVKSSEDVVIGVPSYWRNTKPKYRSHLQSWRIPRL